tara:strand:- start:10446 stop:10679 length:234 start_codon:yes stop_codon:yes gene_type:complete
VTAPKPLHYATISYRTPARRRVLFSGVIASRTIEGCREKLCERLRNEERYGRRRIGEILDDFSALSLGSQISKRRLA